MKFCLIGEKLGHSYSKDIHSLKGIDYSLVEIEKSNLEKFVKTDDFCGFNVTIPYKKDVIKYLDFTSLEATGVGAVNVVVKKDGKSYGYNTDVAGIEYTFIKNHVEIKDKNVLIFAHVFNRFRSATRA